MTTTIVSRLNALGSGKKIALLSGSLTMLATAAAQLTSEATFRVFSDVHVDHIRLAVLVTAALVAAPLVTALTRTTVRMRDEKRRLVTRDKLLSTAQGYAKQGHWEFDVASGRFILSDAMHDLLGDPDKKLLLTTSVLMEMMNPEDRETVATALERVLMEGSQEQIEHRITGLDGKERTFWVTAARQLGRDGKPIKAFGISQDITNQKMMQTALRDSEDFYRHAVELSPHMPWTADAQGNQLDAPPQWQELTGLTPEECLGTGWTRALHPQDVKSALQAWEEPLRTGKPYSTEHRVRVADGSYRWFRARASARRDERGRIIRWYGTVEDVHERKVADLALQESEAALREAEAALRESEDHYRHAVELSPLISWTADPEGNPLKLSDRWRATTGLSPEESCGTGWTHALHQDDRKPTFLAWMASVHSGAPLDVECRLRMTDGSFRWFQARASARRDDNGNIIRWYGSLEDIHDRRMADIQLRESETFASSILDSTVNCLRVLDLEGRVQYINKPGLLALEIDDFSSVCGQEWAKLWPDETLPKLEEALAAAKAGSVGHFTGFGPTAKGTPKWWDVSVTPIPGLDGRPARLLAISHDRTAEKLAEDKVELARERAEGVAERLREVLESTTDCVFILDKEWRLQFANQRAKDLFQRDYLQIGQSVWKQFPGVANSEFEKRVILASKEEKVTSFEEFFPPLNIWLEVHIYPSAEGTSLFYRDVTAKRRTLAELECLARYDSLTGLLNRSSFRERTEQQLEHSTCSSQTALLLLDLDDFKSVNDSMGHPVGDRLLKEAAVRLQACLRSTDLIARIGGDEFAILQTKVKNTDQIESLAQRIVKCFRKPYLVDHQEVVVGTSVGIAVATSSEAEVDELVRKADIALYQAKADGRGIYRFFEPGMDTVAEELQRLRSDLREAVTREEFRVHYQPVVEFETSRVMAFEALVRWQHPWRGLLSPADFISLAESTGAIEEIGAWVLQEACSVAATWPEEISISVNLSPRQFRGRCLIEAVSRALSRSGLAAHRLQLEITESVLLQDDEVVRRTLERLRAFGVRISIDDFGTGYSSLGYLQRFAVDNIKIDRSFVVALLDSERTSAILRAVMSLGEDLGVTLTAEGIETVAQLEKLKTMGCRQGQGYLFARPMPPELVPSFISESGGSPVDHENTGLLRLVS